MKTICFKSNGENYRKERLGLKNNTLRKYFDLEANRKDIVDEWLECNNSDLNIEIYNKETGDFFVRQVTDITLWNDWIIISWKEGREE